MFSLIYQHESPSLGDSVAGTWTRKMMWTIYMLFFLSNQSRHFCSKIHRAYISLDQENATSFWCILHKNCVHTYTRVSVGICASIVFCLSAISHVFLYDPVEAGFTLYCFMIKEENIENNLLAEGQDLSWGVWSFSSFSSSVLFCWLVAKCTRIWLPVESQLEGNGRRGVLESSMAENHLNVEIPPDWFSLTGNRNCCHCSV